MSQGIAPFKRGHTFFGPTQTLQTTEAGYGTSVGIEGHIQDFKDMDWSSQPLLQRSQRLTKCIAVRNVSTITLSAKQLVSWKAGKVGKRVDGHTEVTGEYAAGVVDEALPASGCRNHDICWLAVRGPALCTASSAGDGENVISANDVLMALTAANSTHTTLGGRVISSRADDNGGTYTATQTTDGTAFKEANNQIGRAMSAKTTAQTVLGGSADVLVDLCIYKG